MQELKMENEIREGQERYIVDLEVPRSNRGGGTIFLNEIRYL